MNVSAAARAHVQRLVPTLPNIAEGNKNFVRAAWDRLHGLPGGKRVFSSMIGRAAPYTGTIGSRVVELARGHSRVELTDRKAVRNHLRSVHAVALVNLAELTGNVAVAYSLPDDARFIVAGLEIAYLKKARGTITGVCDVDVPQTSERHEMPVVVDMLDSSGDVVARATLRTLIGPKKKN
jgi:acyl-coenzyme A thioesterase PaaI-like protein